MDWQDCLNKKIAKKVIADRALINSLIKTSINKLKSESQLVLNEITTSSKISLAYDSLRELLESLALKNNYKVYGHEAYTPFLKEIMKLSNMGDEFNELRKIRNSINYYGEEVSIREAISIIKRIKSLRKKIFKIIEEK